MARHKFKNPMVNNQYKKPACHTDYCFQRHACCNNYRCCVCHCCLKEYQVYNKALDRCVGNLTENRIEQRKIATVTDLPPTTKKQKKDFTTENRIEQRKIATATDLPPTTKKQKKDFTTEKVKHKLPKREQTTKAAWQETTKRPLERSTRKLISKVSRTKKGNSTSTLDTWTPTFKESRPPSNIGLQNSAPDDKTSIIAGVAVALALVGIVALVVLVILCSRRKKRNRSKAVETKTSNNDTAVVTIPLTMENVPDKFRDNEEGTTSDTTIDSPVAQTSIIRNGTPDNPLTANGIHPTADPRVGGSKKSGKKHKKTKHVKENGTAEHQRLCKGHQLNGKTEHQQLGGDRVSHPTGRANHCSKNHVFLGAAATNIANGNHYVDGSLECNV